MDMTNYKALANRLDSLPNGYPATDDGAELRLLAKLFTPEEAKVAMHLSMKPEPARQIHYRISKSGSPLTIQELQLILERMLYKGTLRPYYEGYDETHYGAPDPTAGGMISVQLDDKLTREFYDLLNVYMDDVMKVNNPRPKTHNPLRTVPVGKSISYPEKFPVGNYDDIRKLIEDAPGPFAVANCICRQKTKRFGAKCTSTDLEETCLMIDPDHAKHYVEMGVGRFIVREEVFDILERARQDGLVVQPENSQKPEAVCICCGDCCVFLKPIKALPSPAEMFLTNFYVEVDTELCNGCEICVEKCQMDARNMVDSIAVVNLDRCIGCGNCVVLCTSNANSLQKKEQEIIPPDDKEAYYQTLLSHKQD